MSNPHQFPNVRDKLSAPSKKSAFEKARVEAEEKRKREEAETAAVYKDFVASFDEGPPDGPALSSFRGGHGRGGAGFRGVGGSGAPGRRHFSGGRGGLGGVPPPPLRKRNLGDAFERDEEEGGIFGSAAAASSSSSATLTDHEKRRLKDGSSGLLAFENSGPSKRRERYVADEDSDTEVAPHPKPTLLLSSLPPNITKAAITDLLATTSLKIDSIRVVPAPPPPGPSQPSPSVRKAASALVTLSQDTPVSNIEAAVSSLNGQYIGYGFWLGIVRHLSSAVTGSAATGIPIVSAQSHPFGAKAPRAAPSVRGGSHRGRFAPPPSFGPPGRAQQQQQSQSGHLQVHVHPPQDLKVLRLIHGTIEALLTHGTEFEALLMSKDEVRNDPKFAWLWDARSPAGVYYRWKLWEIVTGFSIDKPYTPTVDIFDSSSAVWVPPKKPLKYEWAGSLDDVVEDYDFMSDELDEDDSDDGNHDDRPVGLAGGEGKKSRGYLGVLERAKLVHLISRVPTTTSKVRRGDVGRVMAFAMEHAEGGMGEEVVDILVSNVLKPLAFTKAAKRDSSSEDSGAEKEKDDQPDTSSAKIVGLWIISDVLSNSSLGVRAAWRYRQLFDTALRERKVFSHLGEIYRESGWGRMKAEKFRRMVVEGVLEGWEKWCIFPQATYDAFLEAFLSGPEKKDSGSSKEQKSRSHTPTATATAAPQSTAATKSRWKTVEATPSVFDPKAQPLPVADDDDDVDGEPMVDDDDDVDGEPMVEDDDDVDDEAMVEDSDPYDPPEEIVVEEPKKGEPKEEPKKDEPKKEESKEEEKPPAPTPRFGGMAGFKIGGTAAGAGPKRKRPKAEDMFADDYD